MVDTSAPNDPEAFQKWIKQLEQRWQAGVIPDPQAVAIILLNNRNEVLLQLRDNNPKISFANFWTLPGGVVEPHETPQQAAHRQLAEETGLHVGLSLWKTYKRKPQNRQFFIEQHVYFGRTQQEVHKLTLGEGQALQFFARDKLPSLSIAFEFDRLLDEFFDEGSYTPAN
ncbi:MAG TPA: NUDIX domain-containing protein [Anaerolineales bacterium]|nr:NUDIX domain-containing protein [Anaerolineales bacterium]